MTKRILLASPHMSDEGYEQAYVKEAFDTNWIAPLGENVNKFEEELAEYAGVNYAAALSSGTAAIHLALKAANVGKGDIVFCQSLTFSATANPIIYQNAIPVFIDSDQDTWNMNIDALKEAFKQYQPKAVIVVNLYGIPAKLAEIKQLCEENQAVLIEDAAESLGSTHQGQQTGSFGDYGIYSFNGNKIITTSGGGMLVSENKSMIQKARFWATQSREQALHYEHKELGYNYRMSNVSAGIGRGQLKVLNERVKKKRAIYQAYEQAFKDISDIKMMPNPADSESNCWLSAMTLSGDKTPTEIIEALNKENIESRPVWKPMHLQPYFEKYDYVGGTVSQDLFERGVCLPSDTKMTEEEQERVIEIIKELWK